MNIAQGCPEGGALAFFTLISIKIREKMKKLFTIVAVAATMLACGKANAQLSINVGYAPQTYTTTYNSTSSVLDMNGFFAGANYNLTLSGDLKVSVGADVRYNNKTDKSSASLFGISASNEITKTQMLLDVPVLFNYGLNLSSNFKLAAFVGPTFSYALSGKETSETAVAGWGGKTEMDWYGDNSNRKKFDISATFGVMLGISHYRLFGGYNLGLLNLTSTDNTTIKGTNWFIGFGYDL